jgi:tRNA(fMet)-specific endonuclease VapC
VKDRLNIQSRFRDAHGRGFIFGTCVPVLAELEFGFAQKPPPDRYRKALQAIRRFVRLWPLDESLAREFGATRLELKRKGRALSMTDTFLAALCRQMNLVLLSTDNDFDALPDIRRENWL